MTETYGFVVNKTKWRNIQAYAYSRQKLEFLTGTNRSVSNSYFSNLDRRFGHPKIGFQDVRLMNIINMSIDTHVRWKTYNVSSGITFPTKIKRTISQAWEDLD